MRFSTIGLVALGALITSNALGAGLSDIVDVNKGRATGINCNNATLNLEVNDHNEGLLVLSNRSGLLNLEGRSVDRVSCNLSVPIQLPANKRLVLRQASTSSLLLIDRRASGKLNLDLFIGKSGEEIKQEESLRGGSRGIVQNVFDLDAKSECGAQSLLRANQALVINNTRERAGRAQLRDVIIELSVENCE